ncbi:MAG: hypothetical protein JNM27_03320 [Leptospirales bacterium]|nr:hypothetical protein [Leptospirales bacterium]
MRLTNLTNDASSKILVFADTDEWDRTSYSIKITANSEGNIIRMEFLHSSGGFALWIKEKGFTSANRWEDENHFQGPMYHYPKALLNGAISISSESKWITDLIQSVPHTSLQSHLRLLLSDPARDMSFDFSNFSLSSPPDAS